MSDPEWAPYFIQYKLLKKYIKAIRDFQAPNVAAAAAAAVAPDGDSGGGGEGRRGATTEDRVGLENMASLGACDAAPKAGDGDAATSGAPGQKTNLSKSAPEVAFFRAVRVELHKSSQFFKSAEAVLEIRRERVSEALRQLRLAAQRGPPGTAAAPPRLGLLEDADERALSACVTYYRDLLLLENYAIINYCGFSKILKKHDKQTGFVTRAQFMRICVAPQPFTHYPRLLEMIKEAEELYRDIDAAARDVRISRQLADQSGATASTPNGEGGSAGAPSADEAAEAPAPPLSREASSSSLRDALATTPTASTPRGMRRDESDFIDAILEMRSEASKIRAAEDDRGGQSTPSPTNDDENRAAFPFASASPAQVEAPKRSLPPNSPSFPVLQAAPQAKRARA